MMKKVKVLVVSHNAFSLTNNMGKTLNSLFCLFNKENLAQLYFHVLDSDVETCSHSFRITDMDVLRSLIHANNCVSGSNECKKSANLANKINKTVYQYGQKRSATKHLLRDLLWKIGHWKSRDLIKWMDNYNPNVIFFAAGYSMFSIDIAIFIAKEYNIPLVTYFCDDYYDVSFSSCKYSLISKIRMCLFKRRIKVLVDASEEIVFISESMEKKYRTLFNKDGQVIMTPYTISQSKSKSLNKTLVMSFVGSVLSNRWRTLIKIGEALERINSQELKIILNIYSVATDETIISKLSIGNSMIFKGFADAEMVKNVYFESDILLHVESFLPEDINRVKYSVSTKIADNLASSRAFLAVGPKGIASIDYLEKNNAAYVIDDESMIENKLKEFFVDSGIDEEIIENARTLAEKNHNINRNAEQLKTIFEKIVKDYNVNENSASKCRL